MFGEILQAAGAAKGVMDLFGGNDGDGQAAYNQANPFLGWQQENILPRINDLLTRQNQVNRTRNTEMDELLKMVPGIRQQVNTIGQDPNLTKLRDVAKDQLTRMVSNPRSNPNFNDQSLYNTMFRNLVQNPDSFNTSPAAQASLKRGLDAVGAKAASSGLLGSTNYLDQMMEKGQENFSGDYYKFLEMLSGAATNQYNQGQGLFNMFNTGYGTGDDVVKNAYAAPNAQLDSMNAVMKFLTNQDAAAQGWLSALSSAGGLNKGSPEGGAKLNYDTNLMNEARKNSALQGLAKVAQDYENQSKQNTVNTTNAGFGDAFGTGGNTVGWDTGGNDFKQSWMPGGISGDGGWGSS